MMLRLSPKNLKKMIRKLRLFKSRAKQSRNRRRNPLLRRSNKLRRQRLISPNLRLRTVMIIKKSRLLLRKQSLKRKLQSQLLRRHLNQNLSQLPNQSQSQKQSQRLRKLLLRSRLIPSMWLKPIQCSKPRRRKSPIKTRWEMRAWSWWCSNQRDLLPSKRLNSKLRSQELPTPLLRRELRSCQKITSGTLRSNCKKLGKRRRTNLEKVDLLSSSRTQLYLRTPWEWWWWTIPSNLNLKLRLRSSTLRTQLKPRPALWPWLLPSKQRSVPPSLTINQVRKVSSRTSILTYQSSPLKYPQATALGTTLFRKWPQATNNSTWFHGTPTKNSIIWEPSKRGQKPIKDLLLSEIKYQKF